MKDYNEMAASVFLRAAEYEAAQKKRRRRAATAACCLCLAAAVGFGALRNAPAPAAQFANEDEAAAHGGREPVDLDSGGLDGDPNGYSGGKALDWDYNDPLHEQRTTLGELESENAGKSPYVENAEAGGGKAGRLPSNREDAPAQGPYLESPGREAAVDNAVYGGVYMDGQGVTHVLLTEDTPENRAAVRSIVPLPDEAIVFDIVTYSHAELEALQSAVSQGMADRELPFVTTSALDERNNRVRVTVTTGDEASLAKLRAYDTLGGALVIERGAMIAQEDVLVNEDARNLPATEPLNDAEHLPEAEGATNDARSAAP